MRDLGTPILDNHLHLDADNRGIEAVQEFARAGGTHLLIVNKPSWHVADLPTEPDAFRPVFEETIGLVHAATAELPGRAWPVLGVHPALVSRLIDDEGYTPGDARDLMVAGLEVAAEYAADGNAVALKTGRPHYDVSDVVWNASNAVLRRGLELAAETDVAIQLHTEATEDLTEVAAWAADAGVSPHRVVKHYASGTLTGVTKSVMSRTDFLETAIEVGEPFLMETDFIDDAERPGAVMGPKTVPRRVDWMLETGYEDAVRVAHVDTPASVYGIDTEATLG